MSITRDNEATRITSPCVFLTGASGFIGSRLKQTFAARGYNVGAIDYAELSRSVAGSARQWARHGQVGTIVHLEDGLRTFEGKLGAGSGPLDDAALRPTLELARHSVSAGASTFIYMSSIRAIAAESAPELLRDESEPRPQCLYGRLKRKTELALAELLGGTSVRLVVLRPPLVYGIGNRGNFKRLLRLAAKPLPLPLAGLDNARSMLFVDNLADAVLAVHERQDAEGGTFLIHDGVAVSTTELVTLLRNGLGRPANLFALPSMAWRAVRRIPSLRPLVRRLIEPLAVTDERFRRRFDWQPPVDGRVALAETARRFASQQRSHHSQT